jgi:predicted DNA-binding ribbon-helix-helix protein
MAFDLGGIRILRFAERVASRVGWGPASLTTETIMKSPVVKRSVVIDHHKTSVSLEDAFWGGLKDIARSRTATMSGLVAAIDTERQHGNLSSAIRLFVLNHFRAQAIEGAQSQATRANPMAQEREQHGALNGGSPIEQLAVRG